MQNAIKAVLKYHKEIIPVSPFSFVLSNQSAKYEWNTSFTDKIMRSFREYIQYTPEKLKTVGEDHLKLVSQQCKELKEPQRLFKKSTEYVNVLRKNSKREQIDTHKLSR